MPDLERIESLSGEDIIDDVCSRIAEELSRSVHLRRTDSYVGFTGKILVELQLDDYVNHETARHQLVIGEHDPARPSRRFEIEIAAAPATTVRERNGLVSSSSSLERPVDVSASGTTGTSIRQPRWRAQRQRPEKA